MRETYGKASAVLILDASLLARRKDEMYDLEILTRILCSRWTSRLWTLQEKALANRLFCQFADGPYNALEGIDRMKSNQDVAIKYTTKQEILLRFRELRIFRAPETLTDFQNFVSISRALQFRATSVATNEPLCLSTLLGVDIRKMMEIDKNSRIKHFWLHWSQIGIPEKILFLPSSQRLTSDAYRWAPQSFLRRSDGSNEHRLPRDQAPLPIDDLRLTNRSLTLEAGVMLTSYTLNGPIRHDFFLYVNQKEMKGWMEVIIDQKILVTYLTQCVDPPERTHRCGFTPPRGFKVNPPATPFKNLACLHIILDVKADQGTLLSGSLINGNLYATPICRVDLKRLDTERDRNDLRFANLKTNLVRWRSMNGLPLNWCGHISDSETFHCVFARRWRIDCFIG